MNTIIITIDYDGEITLGKEYSASGPLSLNWFSDNDLLIETKEDSILFNTNKFTTVNDGLYIIRPKKTDKQLHVVATEKATLFQKKMELELAHNSTDKYLIINVDGKKFAYKLPEILLA